MNDSFWDGSPEAYADGIKTQYEEKLAELNSVLAKCKNEFERQRVEQEILAVKDNYKEKLNGSDWLIF